MFLFVGNTHERTDKVMGHPSATYLDIISRVKRVKGFSPLYCNYSFSVSLGCFKVKRNREGKNRKGRKYRMR